jgi:molybdopterin/thiamine biosynthesis adenylyltransferase
MKAWFENDIQRLEREKSELQALDVSFKIDEEAMKQKLLRIQLHISGNNLHFDLPDKNSSIELIAVYPDTYPFFRPNVYADDIDLPRHQNPLDKGLCLLARPTDLWDPQMTLASFLQQQLKKVLVHGQKIDVEELSKDETEQAEPISEYFNTQANVIIDPSIINNDPANNSVECIGRITVGIPKDETRGLRYAVLQIKDSNGNKILSELPSAFDNLFPDKIQGVLYRIDKLQPFSNPIDQVLWLKKELEAQKEKIYFHGTDYKIKHGRIVKNVIGLNFPEETAAGKKEMTGWIFLVVGDLYQSVKEGGPKARHNFCQYAKASRISGNDINVRIPKLKPLQEKSIAIIGLGSLGAPSAIEFARIGISELRLLDYDTVDVATTVRWPLGISAAEVMKTAAIKDFIESNYPFTKVDVVNLKIGQSRATGETSSDNFLPFDLPEVDKILNNISLVFDASAEGGVTHFFAEECRTRKIPFVSIQATQGAVGGQILRVIPGKTDGCWMCSMWHRHANEKEPKIEAAPFEQSGKIQATGCGDITFTGASFDLQNIVSAGVRLAVSSLCEGIKDAYPSFDWDVGVLALVDKQGKPILPEWKNYKLEKHPNCPYCERE